MSMRSKEEAFYDLMARVQACRKCPRMESSARVLGLGCGPLSAKTMFIGEAPGRLGADGSNLPFHGDKSGDNFEQLIQQVGISRYDIFVTNAVLCNPKDAFGNNATPNTVEIANCAPFLREQIELLDPVDVVTLGATALRACDSLERHALTLRDSVRTARPWFGRHIIPLYHPGQRAMIHRSFANQLADYQFVAERIRRRENGDVICRVKSKSPIGDERIVGVVERIIGDRPAGVGYFALHKMFFLSEVARLEKTGDRLTSAYIIRQKDGPYCVDLQLRKLINSVPGLLVRRHGTKITLRWEGKDLFHAGDSGAVLLRADLELVDDVVRRYGGLSDAQLKTAAYMARPMRSLLQKEKRLGMNLFNAPILSY